MSRLAGPERAVQVALPLNNGKSIPQLGFGTYRMHPSKVGAAVEFALECGFRHVDCATIYGNEREVGAALQRAQKRLNLRRQDLFLTSKLWPTDQHPDHVAAALRSTLDALQTDYLDLYLIHWPVCWRHTGRYDTEEDRVPRTSQGLVDVVSEVHLKDTWAEMESLVRSGRVHSIGVSNCSAKEISQLCADATIRPVTNQVELHPACPQAELRAAHGVDQIVTSSYCPLGMPTRFTPTDFLGVQNHPFFQKVSEYTGYSPARCLLQWNLDLNNVVLVKSEQKQHIKANAAVQRYAFNNVMMWAIDKYVVIEQQRVLNPRGFRGGDELFFPAVEIPKYLKESPIFDGFVADWRRKP